MERFKSARFVVFIVVTVIASAALIWIVGKASESVMDKIAVIIVTGFFNVWSSICTFYFTRSDRKKEGAA